MCAWRSIGQWGGLLNWAVRTDADGGGGQEDEPEENEVSSELEGKEHDG